VIAEAQDGDQILFHHSLRGQTITLTSGELALTQSLDIEGLGADQLAVSGNHHSRVFSISGGATVTIGGLTITDGLAVGAPGTGGGILNTGSNLTVANVVLSNNEAHGSGMGGLARGGAIESIAGATLTVTHGLFIHNRAIGGEAGGFGRGGGLNNQNDSTATVTDSMFIGNQAIGGNGGVAASSARDYDISFGYGGGLFNHAGAVVVHGCTFTYNQALGGSQASGTFGRGHVGDGSGGGLINLTNGTATITDSTFAHNEARGGSGNIGGDSASGGRGAFIVGWGLGGAITNEGWGGPGLS
jgi:hypothetical protein